jgi:hypothetical protein
VEDEVTTLEGTCISADESGSEVHRSRGKIPGDVVVAGLALLISALATAAGWWQTHVIAQQLSAQVWPYVTVAGNYGTGALRLSVDNDGLGPAIVESFVVLVDGKPQHDVVAAMHALVGSVKRGDAHSDLEVGSITAGQVLRTNSATLLFSLSNKDVAPGLAEQMSRRLTIQTCYCSIVDNCWTFTISAIAATNRPVAVAHCTDAGSAQFQQPTPAEMENPTL